MRLQRRMGPPTIDGRRLNRIVVAGLSDNLRDDLVSRLGVHEGDMMTPEAMQRVRSAAMAFDEHINIGTMYGKDNEVTLILSMPGARANAGGVTRRIP